MSAAALSTLDHAVTHGLLVQVPSGRWERNSHVLQHKYQLNPMLSPLFDLSPSLRGSANFSAEELNTIFDPSSSDSTFLSMRRRLLTRFNAPFQPESAQASLGFE
jgi:hypothetical protein